MAKVIIGHRPELTAEAAREVFESQFAHKYRVYKSRRRGGYNFSIRESAWRGVNVKLEQKPGRTAFVLEAMTPSWAVTMLFLLLWIAWLALGVRAASGGGVGTWIGFGLWLALGLWLIRFVQSRLSKKLINTTKAMVENTAEFKQPEPPKT